MEPLMRRDPLNTLLWAALAEMILLMLAHLLCSTMTLSAAVKPSTTTLLEFLFLFLEASRANPLL